MANTVKITAKTDDKASGPIDNLRDKIDKLKGQGAKGFGLGVGAAVGAKAFSLIDTAAAGAIDAVKGTIDAASDLNETISKSGVIFGKNAESVNAWADTMASAAGISKRAALDAASGFAGLFKTVGLSIDESTQMSEKLTQMGSDLASFFNTDVDTALTALKSGLNGEAEPLRAFNVFLSDTAVTAKLASQGIKKVNGNFTEAQKATARYQLIMEQTTDAQGDFGRTSDGLANTQRQIAAEMENVSATIGNELLPVMLDLAHLVRDEGVPALSTLTDVLHNAADGMQVLGDVANKVTFEGVTSPDKVMGIKRLTHAEALAAGAAGKIAEKTGEAADGISDVKDAAREATDKLKDMRGAIRDAGKALGDQKFGHQELNLKIKDTKIDLAENIDKLKDLERIKHPTRDQRQDIIETKLAIIEDKKEIIDLKAELAATGKVNMSITDKWINRIKNDGSEAADQIAELRRQLLLIPGAKPSGGGGGGGAASGGGGGKNVKQGDIPRAGGGPVLPGNTYTVGENGPETLVMGGSGGRVIPHSGGSAGGMVFNFTFNGGADQGQAHAHALFLADSITSTLRQQRARAL